MLADRGSELFGAEVGRGQVEAGFAFASGATARTIRLRRRTSEQSAVTVVTNKAILFVLRPGIGWLDRSRARTSGAVGRMDARANVGASRQYVAIVLLDVLVDLQAGVVE